MWGATHEPHYKDNRRIKVNCWVTTLDCSYLQRRGIHLWRNSYCSMLDPHCSPLLPWWVCQPVVNGKSWPSIPVISQCTESAPGSGSFITLSALFCNNDLLTAHYPAYYSSNIKHYPPQHTKQSAYQQDDHFNDITVIVIMNFSEVIFPNIVKLQDDAKVAVKQMNRQHLNSLGDNLHADRNEHFGNNAPICG